MPTLFDYLERSVTGPIMTPKDFQMKVLIPNVRRIVNEYDIKTQKQSDKYARLYEEVLNEVIQMGIPCD
jgi:hypothetical protein